MLRSTTQTLTRTSAQMGYTPISEQRGGSIMAKVADALKLHGYGWRVVAAPLAGKSPIGS